MTYMLHRPERYHLHHRGGVSRAACGCGMWSGTAEHNKRRNINEYNVHLWIAAQLQDDKQTPSSKQEPIECVCQNPISPSIY